VIEQALSRWMDALHALGEPAFVEAAFTHDAVVVRHDWNGDRDPLEVFEGQAKIGSWLARSPRGVRFTHDPPEREGSSHRVSYTVSLQDFVNRGRWIVLLGEDGRIARLEHRPDPLPKTQELP